MTNPQLEPTAAWPSTSTVPSSSDRFAALFADPSDPAGAAGPRGARPWFRRHRRVAIVVALVVAVVVGAFATDAFGSGGNSYRLAVVGDHAVDTVLTSVATIEPVSQAKVAFPVSGKVATVNVKSGDQIAVGQTLATLDTQSLIQTLHNKELALAQAKLTLSKALSGQSTGGSGSGGGAGGGGSGGAASATLSAYRTGGTGATAVLADASGTSTDPQLAAAQQAVVTAQQNVDTALAAAKAALDNATTVCAAGSNPAQLAACQTALGDVQTAQTAVDTAQHKLADASSALDTLLAQRASSTPTTPTTTPSGAKTGGSGTTTGGTGSSGGSGGSGGSGLGGSGSSKSTAPSSADLASDQAAVDAATAQVAVAYQSVLQATITSPIQGTVEAVNLAVGDSVTSASTTANVIVQGPGGFEVTTSVSVTKVPDVVVGQRATLVPDGGHDTLTGKVTSISVAPSSTSSSATSYRVVVGLDNPDAKVGNGSTGTVSIVTKSAKPGLAVPSSAITSVGRGHVVTVMKDGSPQTVAVGVGVVGSNWTQITSGLTRGEQVVLADLSSPLPNSATATNSTTTNNRGFGGAGLTFPGGGGIIRLPGGTGGGR